MLLREPAVDDIESKAHSCSREYLTLAIDKVIRSKLALATIPCRRGVRTHWLNVFIGPLVKHFKISVLQGHGQAARIAQRARSHPLALART